MTSQTIDRYQILEEVPVDKLGGSSQVSMLVLRKTQGRRLFVAYRDEAGQIGEIIGPLAPGMKAGSFVS